MTGWSDHPMAGFHRISPARAVAYHVLRRVLERDAYAAELLHSGRLDQLSAADRRLATELVMGVLRWQSRLDAALGRHLERRLVALDPEVLVALRLGAYQVMFLDRVPARAAVNESVELAKRAGKRSAASLVNAVLRRLANDATVRQARERAPATPGPPSRHAGPPLSRSAEWGEALSLAQLAGHYAHPPWLVERWAARWGADTAARICAYDQQAPPTALRLADAEAEAALRAAGIELAPGRLMSRARLVVAGEVTRTSVFAEGRIFLHDEASQLVAALLGAGNMILDCCAAPGGKTAMLAERNPAAMIIAAELHPHRARLLRRLARARNIQVIAADACALPLTAGFDHILADVPCSGTGTLARNPEIKWRLAPSDLAELHRRQTAILTSALGYLAPGGRLLFATCSLEEEENTQVVEEALAGGRSFRLRDCRAELLRLREAGELAWQDVDSLVDGAYLRTIPGVHPCDGFFAAPMAERL